MHSYELAFRMQSHAPDAIDISKETDATKKLYGVGEKPTDYFGRQLLMARRLVERGVRYVQIFSGGGNFDPSWDAHWNLKENHGLHCAETDAPMAGLIKDLKSRGMFDSTLIVWHGEFGRLPISERMSGRDHNNKGFTVWLAGGGVKGGTCVGSTDQYGYAAAENPKSVYELHATDPAPAGPRIREPDVPIQRPRHAADRRPREGDQGDTRVERWRWRYGSAAGGTALASEVHLLSRAVLVLPLEVPHFATRRWQLVSPDLKKQSLTVSERTSRDRTRTPAIEPVPPTTASYLPRQNQYLPGAQRLLPPEPSAFAPASAHCASCSPVTPLTPTAPTTWPSTTSGTPPSSGMKSAIGSRAVRPPLVTSSSRPLVSC